MVFPLALTPHLVPLPMGEEQGEGREGSGSR